MEMGNDLRIRMINETAGLLAPPRNSAYNEWYLTIGENSKVNE